MRILKLDGLRGFFSCMIILLHFDKKYLPPIFDNFFINHSYVFVDFFFVLSGFVISLNYNSINDIKKFIKKRFIRLYPLYFYSNCLFFTYILFSRLILLRYFPSIFEDESFSYKIHVEPFIDSVFLTNSTPLIGDSPGSNGPSWSISAEIISYLTFAIITLFFRKKIRLYLFSLIIIIAMIICLNYGVFFDIGNIGFLRGFVGFFMGFFVWKIYSKNYISKINNKLELLIPIFLILIMFILDALEGFKFQYIYGMLLVPLFFSISIFMFIHSAGLISKIFETKLFQYLGKISFSIYLNHWIFLYVIVKPIYRILEVEQNFQNQVFVLIFTILSIIGYSHLTNKYIENKIGDYLKRNLL